IFLVSKTFPREETYSLTDQMRRSSRSIGAQVAEAGAKRRNERHFVSKLTDADGEQQETQHWPSGAGDCGYRSAQEVTRLSQKCTRIGRLLGGMMAKSTLFCDSSAKTIREELAEYYIPDGDLQ